MEGVTYKVATVMPLAAGFLTFVAVECFVDQLVAPIKFTVGQYLAKYLLACSGPVVTKYLNIYLAYILSYKTNIENLLKQVKKLKAARDMVRCAKLPKTPNRGAKLQSELKLRNG